MKMLFMWIGLCFFAPDNVFLFFLKKVLLHGNHRNQTKTPPLPAVTPQAKNAE